MSHRETNARKKEKHECGTRTQALVFLAEGIEKKEKHECGKRTQPDALETFEPATERGLGEQVLIFTTGTDCMCASIFRRTQYCENTYVGR
jgi:hypothetical protein